MVGFFSILVDSLTTTAAATRRQLQWFTSVCSAPLRASDFLSPWQDREERKER
jgi:hypothetical protein